MCLCTGTCPHIYTFLPALLLLGEGPRGDRTPFSSHQLQLRPPPPPPLRLPLCCQAPASRESSWQQACGQAQGLMNPALLCHNLFKGQSAPLKAPSLPSDPFARKTHGDPLGPVLEPTDQSP